MYDLILRGGRLLDPAQSIHSKHDVAFQGGHVANLAQDLGEAKAAETIDCSNLLITPGMIDLHVHCYAGVSHYGIDPDEVCLKRGVTTAVDAGTSGALTFQGLRRYVINVSATRLFAFLNISRIGLITGIELDPPLGELEDLRNLNVAAAVDCIRQNQDLILGIKVRLSANLSRNGETEKAALKLAREASDITGLPIMIHTPSSSLGLPPILKEMRERDILTHCFHGMKSGILGEDGKIISEVHDARDRGVLLDVGHGKGSFSYEIARHAMREGILPDTISSDLHRYNIHGPVFDLASTVSKLIHLGLPLEHAIARVTSTPARAILMDHTIGSLGKGFSGDAVVFRHREGTRSLPDTMGITEDLHEWIEPAYVIKAGRVVAQHSLTE